MNNVESLFNFNSEPYVGKVRDVYTVSQSSSNCSQDDRLVIVQTDRCSAFDHHICNIEGKGSILTETAAWWFKKMGHVMPNHYLHHTGNMMIVKKCLPIKLEIIVRNYITGSLWNHYSKGNREYCGVELPDGLQKNTQLPHLIITPTTKGEVDEPISANQIVEQGYLTQEQWDYISCKVLEMFRFGMCVAEQSNLILVDTKYEFGFDKNGVITLMDEVHTADSSRYWKKETYPTTHPVNSSGEPVDIVPDKLDKDAVRDYLKENGFNKNNKDSEGNVVIPEVPLLVHQTVIESYQDLHKRLSGETVNTQTFSMDDVMETMSQEVASYCLNSSALSRVVILAGSVSDKPHVEKLFKSLSDVGIVANVYYSSAHKNTLEVMNIIKSTEENFRRVIWVTVAGRSNALSGVVAANSKFPVMACPPFKDKVDMMVNINSTLQCPSKVPTMTILEPGNVALACQKIFNL
jgi:phosphoribosylaminoimidazole-succinocarboxamide synthase